MLNKKNNCRYIYIYIYIYVCVCVCVCVCIYVCVCVCVCECCNALLAGLQASSIKPLQLIQSAAVRLIFNEPKRMHVTPLFINLHCLPIAARIKFKALMFAYRTISGSAPLYLNSLLQTYMPSRSLRSASERRITVPSQRGTKSLSRTFSFTVPIWWNDLPNSIRAAESLPIFKKRLKTHLFHLYLTL